MPAFRADQPVRLVQKRGYGGVIQDGQEFGRFHVFA